MLEQSTDEELMELRLNKGQLTKWNDERGFGFIKPNTGGKEVFLHISAVKTTGCRPKVGDTILYEQTHEANGKIRASRALIEGIVSQTATTPKRPSTLPKRKIKERGFLGVALSLAIVAIGLLQIEFSPRQRQTPVTTLLKPDCVIKGNISISTDRKLYHVPGMEDYDETIIDPLKGERWFCSESEAIAAGWQRAPN